MHSKQTMVTRYTIQTNLLCKVHHINYSAQTFQDNRRIKNIKNCLEQHNNTEWNNIELIRLAFNTD